MLKVMMLPDPKSLGKGVSGIHTVIRAYDKILPQYGIEFVHPNAGCDMIVTHAGMGNKRCDIAMLHGMYFTADYRASKQEWYANQHVFNSIRGSLLVTVPSPWVAETLRRDFRLDPIVLPHGIFPEEWEHDLPYKPKTVLWAKNRKYDVCDPTPLNKIAVQMPDFKFFTTIAPNNAPDNVIEIGIQKDGKLKPWIQQVSIVISTVKETWGILYAEALASGTPVVAANYGHVPNLVDHGVTGYIYDRYNVDDTVYGLRWTDTNRATLSRNASELARSKLSWQQAGERIARTMKLGYNMRIDAGMG